MSLSTCNRLLIWFGLSSCLVSAQAPAKRPPDAGSAPIERAIELAAKHRCAEALPLLKDSAAGLADKQLKYRALISTARCAMRLKDGRTTVSSLLALRHEFPHDLEVLYLTTHVFLEIAVDASQELAQVAPDSYQVGILEAETLESQGKWEGAADIYRKIIAQNPKLAEMHFRLGRAILSQPETPETNEQARKEFQRELEIDAANASAEFWLGEIERRDGKAAEAIPHFNTALKLDPTLGEAMLALGMALISERQFAEAVAPLEGYTTRYPEDPAGHYQLGLAYARSGRREDSARELTLQQQLSQKKQGAAAAQGDATPR